MECPKFTVGSAVFVKMRGYTAWPAKIEGIADETPNKVKYHVYFYGTKQIAVCKEEEVCSYLEHREVLGKPKKAKGFNDGILEMDKELGLVIDTVNKDRPSIDNDESGLFENGNPCDETLENNEDSGLLNKHSFDPVPKKRKVGVSSSITEKDTSYEQMLSVLKLECQLVNIVFTIQNSLNLKAADPDTCLNCLNELLNLNVTNLTLKKNPEIVYTVFKLQNYVGNINHWNMSQDAITSFQLKVQQIQNLSKQIGEKYKTMFNVPEGITFLDYFDGELVTFKNCTKHLSLDDIYRLTKDPTNVII